MFSMAKNDRGIRLASAALILLPVAFLILFNSHSPVPDLIIFIMYSIFSGIALIAFLCEKAEEDESKDKASR